jgi:hypothetical protein
MSSEPESLMLQLLRDMRAEIADVRGNMATKDDIAELRAETNSLRADVAADFIQVGNDLTQVRKDLGEQITGLRRAVIEYHTSVVGHGLLISDLEARLRRVELHLNLPTADQH